ncbi:hypothetical protein, partial [Streptomyces sp. NPDC057494]|uniref:hypothetical protein n=1 Tax=Streptomyces sp. NPDC057494 TaxID=3346148 RepID=UPI0036D9AA9C
CPLCGAPHAGDHDAEYHGDLTEQHVRPLHLLASDFSCARYAQRRHNNVPLASGSVAGQCRSKTVIGTDVMQKAMFQEWKDTVKTPQARAHCGVSNR